MQRVANLWKTSIGGKIIILAGALIAFCLSCIGISLVLPSAPPLPTIDANVIQTNAFATVLASLPQETPSSTLEPTFTAALTNTSTPTFADVPVEDYARVASSRFQTFKEALMEFVQLHNQLAADPSLSQNTDWYAHTSATLFRVTAGADELASMNNFPIEYAAFHNEMVAMSEQGRELSANYTLVLDNQDANALNNANSNLASMITHTNQAAVEIGKGSATSTPIPLPTNTIVVFIPAPTSSNPNSGNGFDNNGDGKVTCADFQTQAAAQQAYNAGYSNLDGNDKDGRACESLP